MEFAIRTPDREIDEWVACAFTEGVGELKHAA
jgi:hypothetical protein